VPPSCWTASTSIAPPEPTSGILWAARDSWTEATRHLRIVPRNIELLVVGHDPADHVRAAVRLGLRRRDRGSRLHDYNQYLIPGVFAQTVVFGSSFTAIGIAEDMQKGYIERLRSLPMARSAVLIGRTLSDLVRNCITFAVMLPVAFVIGFRIEGTLFEAALATALLLVFTYSLSWVQPLIGLSVKSAEAANSASFIWIFR
jgi:ABC-2 type transport system permease protein